MPTQMESTATLLSKVKQGDQLAAEKLCSIYLPLLTKWAQGRLPHYARDLSETADLVQTSLLNALQNLEGFEPRHEGAFLAYLRKILINNIRMEIRRQNKQFSTASIEDETDLVHPQSTVLEIAAEKELYDRYEEALSKLTDKDREAVILKVEFGFSHAEIAAAINAPSANAARMTVSRALLTLARTMK